MKRAKSDVVTSFTLPLATITPSRRTVYVSQISITSRSLCEIKTMPTFCWRSCRRIANTFSISGSVSDVVGSSMMMIFASISSARLISTICLYDASRLRTISLGSSVSPIRSNTRLVCSIIRL